MMRLNYHHLLRSAGCTLIVLFVIGALAHGFQHKRALDMRLKECKAQGIAKENCWLDEQARELIQDTHDLEAVINAK